MNEFTFIAHLPTGVSVRFAVDLMDAPSKEQALHAAHSFIEDCITAGQPIYDENGGAWRVYAQPIALELVPR